MTTDTGLTRPVRIETTVPATEPFELASLADVAARLPADRVEHHLGTGLPRLLPDGRIERLPLDAAEVVRTVDHNGCWVMLRALGELPEYREALLALGARLQREARAAGEVPVAQDLLAFVGAPRANVPIHFDVHHHLLVQLRGTKVVGVGDYDDDVERRRQLERGLLEHRLNADREPDRTTEFTLAPGDALVLPAFTFHWVEGGREASVATTLQLTTERTQEQADALRVSARRG